MHVNRNKNIQVYAHLYGDNTFLTCQTTMRGGKTSSYKAVPGNLRPAGRLRPAKRIRAARRVQQKRGGNVYFPWNFTYKM